jgi:hypothetical protein
VWFFNHVVVTLIAAVAFENKRTARSTGKTTLQAPQFQGKKAQTCISFASAGLICQLSERGFEECLNVDLGGLNGFIV